MEKGLARVPFFSYNTSIMNYHIVFILDHMNSNYLQITNFEIEESVSERK